MKTADLFEKHYKRGKVNKSPMHVLFSIIIWIWWAVCIISFFLVVSLLYICTVPFDKFNRIPNRVLKFLGFAMLKINPGWSWDIKGATPEKVSKPTIVVANHQSFLDLPLLYLLPWRMKWVAKKSLFKIPVFGWIIFMTGQIAIDRKSLRSAKKLDKLVMPIKAGIPAMIFPEGTRTYTGDVQSFKNGAFKLAKRYNFNILPVVLDGGFQAMPRGSWTMDSKQQFTISVLDPVRAEEFETEDELKESVFMLIKQELSNIQ